MRNNLQRCRRIIIAPRTQCKIIARFQLADVPHTTLPLAMPMPTAAASACFSPPPLPALLALGLRNFSITSREKEATRRLCEIHFYCCRKTIQIRNIFLGFRQRQNIKVKGILFPPRSTDLPIFNDRSLIEFRIEMEMEMRIKGRGSPQQIEEK